MALVCRFWMPFGSISKVISFRMLKIRKLSMQTISSDKLSKLKNSLLLQSIVESDNCWCLLIQLRLFWGKEKGK